MGTARWHQETGHKQDLVISVMSLSKPGHLCCPDMGSPEKELGELHSHASGDLKGRDGVSIFENPLYREPPPQYLLPLLAPRLAAILRPICPQLCIKL